MKKRRSIADLRVNTGGGLRDDGSAEADDPVPARPAAFLDWADEKTKGKVAQFWTLVERKLQEAQQPSTPGTSGGGGGAGATAAAAE